MAKSISLANQRGILRAAENHGDASLATSRRSCRSNDKPDIFVNIATPKFAAQAIKKVGELGWQQFVTNVSVAVGSVMQPAGFGWRAFMTKWYPEGDQTDNSTVFGYGVAEWLEQVLKQCADVTLR